MLSRNVLTYYKIHGKHKILVAEEKLKHGDEVAIIGGKVSPNEWPIVSSAPSLPPLSRILDVRHHVWRRSRRGGSRRSKRWCANACTICCLLCDVFGAHQPPEQHFMFSLVLLCTNRAACQSDVNLEDVAVPHSDIGALNSLPASAAITRLALLTVPL